MKNSYRTIPELFYYIKENYASGILMYYRINNRWQAISTQVFAQTVENLAFGLREIGLEYGQKVGIISNPSPFWVMADMAIALAGGITVPIFRRISPENLEFELTDAGLQILFIGDPNEYAPVKIYGKNLKKIITIGFNKDEEITVGFNELVETGRISLEKEHAAADKILARPVENDLFTIIYTSGSTGRPKGVMLSHRNLISQIKDAGVVFGLIKNHDIALSTLPLSHIFERTVMLYYLSCGIPVYFVDDLNNIGVLIREVRPTVMTVVPRLLEKFMIKCFKPRMK
jgi:long-chain acyl-CoA synthetase